MGTTVSALYRYPVKSMLGETSESLTLTERGAAGDRVWAVRDEERGGIRGAKKIPSLMKLAASFTGAVADEGSSPIRLTSPDGDFRDSGASDVNEWLSKQLDHRVTLWPLVSPEKLEHYRRGAPDNDNLEAELRQIFGRAPDEPLPDLSLFSEVAAYESPPGTYFDAFPILIMTERSMETMASRRGESNFNVRRFRPNIVLKTDEAGDFPESAWTNQRIRLGDVEFDIVGDCPRCVMTTHGFADLPKDPGIMRALVQENDGNLGVYARITRPGSINVGDALSAS